MAKSISATRFVAIISVVMLSACLELYLILFPMFRRVTYPFGTEIKILAFADPQIRGSQGASLRTKLDIYGNDHYLGNILQTAVRWTRPDHVFVLGDIFSSQWVSTSEFQNRTNRFRSRILGDVETHAKHVQIIAGNHDIGHSGEMTNERVTRFEDSFGKQNSVQVFNHTQFAKPYRVVSVNSMALDGPAEDITFQTQTKQFLASLEPFEGATVLLTHIPLYKQTGLCKDGPRFEYYSNTKNTLKAQNHLSQESSKLVLDSVFGKDNRHGGIILAGHDHEGCRVYYSRDPTDRFMGWSPSRMVPRISHFPSNKSIIAEATVKSMMGEFEGNLGVVYGSFNHNTQRWDFDYHSTAFGVQHIWWIAHVMSAAAIFSVVFLLRAHEDPSTI